MPSDTVNPRPIALLGSTGNTGSAVLRSLLTRGTHDLHIYVRSVAKLETLFPGISLNPKVTIFTGSAKDHNVVKRCIEGSELIICTLGSNDYTPTTILSDSARSIIDALRELKEKEESWRRPRMVYLSSSSKNKKFAAQRPPVVNWLIQTAFSAGYADLAVAEKLLTAEPELVDLLRVQPGVLVEEEGTGMAIDTDAVKLACSYEDLGRACVVLALDREYDALHEIGVSSKGGDRALRYAPIILSRLSGGLFIVFCSKLARVLGMLVGRS